ncbi:MAG: hypothetical protein RBU29_17685, partial [bacterium]|nr:hypothetical protein [bacterium]
YNFSQTKAKGVLLTEHLPAAWQLRMPELPIELEPMQKQEISARLVRSSAEAKADEDCWIMLRGEFGEAGKPVLAFRITRSPGENYPKE